MRKGLLSIVLWAPMVAAASCSSANSPSDIRAQISVAMGKQGLQAFASSSEGSTVTVVGSISVEPCYDNVTVTVSSSDMVIDATINAKTSFGVTCIFVPLPRPYTLTLSGVPKGAWTLRVSHQIEGHAPVRMYEAAIAIRN